jgi:hypothetical protein
VKPILLLEINEVPWRLIDHFRKSGRFPHIERFFSSSETYETVAVDDGELSPWITWPTLYRGVSKHEHGIQFLGQDPGTFRGTPLWEEYRKRGLPIGLCGTLQSWPPTDPGEGGFYVPDTFAHSPECIPKYVEPFQKFNLKQVSENGRVVNSKSLISKELIDLMFSLPKLGIKPKTLLRIAHQLGGEKLHKERLSRRPAFQTILLWDVFKKLFNGEQPPAFSSFFTNHVAGVMHRYWHHVFPEDFAKPIGDGSREHLDTMIFALQFLDEMLSDAMDFCDSNPELTVVFASSMGQAAMVWEDRDGHFFVIKDLPGLMRFCGLGEKDFKHLLAMVPQVAVELSSEENLLKVQEVLAACKTSSGTQIFSVTRSQAILSITVLTPSLHEIQNGGFLFQGRHLTWEEIGIRVHREESGSAYHVPEGILAIYSKRQKSNDKREKILVTEVKPLLMRIGELSN